MESEWTKCTIGDILTLQRGFDITKKEQTLGPIAVVSSGGAKSYHSKAKVKGPGVVLGRKGTLGTVFFLEQDFWPHDTTLWVKDFKGNDERFVYYFFKSMTWTLINLDAGTSNPTLNRNHVHLVDTVCPPLHEQKAIANILGSLDDKIELNRRMNETLEGMAQVLFKSWFVDFDPVLDNALVAGYPIPDALAARAEIRRQALANGSANRQAAQPFPAAFQLTEELGWIPEGWEVSTIGDETEIVGGGTPSTRNPVFWEGGEYPWVTPKDLSSLKDKVLLSSITYLISESLKKVSSGLLPKGTVLMSSRAPVGYLAITQIETAINQGFIAMKCNGRLPPEYILQWANSIMDEIKQASSGSTFAEISKKAFRPFKVLVPMQDSRYAYTDIVAPIYERITNNVAESKMLFLLRDTLLPELISGEIRLNAS